MAANWLQNLLITNNELLYPVPFFRSVGTRVTLIKIQCLILIYLSGVSTVSHILYVTFCASHGILMRRHRFDTLYGGGGYLFPFIVLCLSSKGGKKRWLLTFSLHCSCSSTSHLFISRLRLVYWSTVKIANDLPNFASYYAFVIISLTWLAYFLSRDYLSYIYSLGSLFIFCFSLTKDQCSKR